MRPLSRLWLVLAGGDRHALRALAAALGGRHIATLATAPDAASRATADELCGPLGLEPTLQASLAVSGEQARAALARLAADFTDRELVIVAPEPAVRAALSAALDLVDGSSQPVRLRAGALYAFDWPTGEDPDARVLLLGADLDWLPPWRSGAPHSQYPGGPGAAGTART